MVKSPTQADVAILAGVSRSTVSIVLNHRSDHAISITDETRRRVWDAAQKLGYEPNALARGLRSGQSYNIGTLIPNLYNPHYLEILDGIEQTLANQLYHLTLVVTNFDPERERRCFQMLFQQQLDGLILMPTFWDKLPEEMAILAERGSPAVFLPSQEGGIDSVNSDIQGGAEKLMDHLLSKGHRRIGFVNGSPRRELTAHRYQVYCEKIKTAGIHYDPTLVQDCGPTMQDGYTATSGLLELTDPPTAIWTINDVLAVGAIRAVHEHGLRIPADVAIAGCDDTSLASQLFPSLTTVHIPSTEMGKRAAEIVLNRIQNPDCAPMRETFHTYLVVRHSTDSTMR